MQFATLKVLTMFALSAVVSSCDSKVETHLQFPPVADLKVDPEPVYPVAALEPGEVGQQAEDSWRDEILIWGRKGWAQTARVCKWAVELGLEVPKGYCG